MLAAVEHLANHIHEAPVWIVPCLEDAMPTRTSGSSIYPAVQNMLLAARALGLGATLTTLYLQFEKEAEAALGLPPNVHSYALLPIGYPMGRFGPVRRVAPMLSTRTDGASLTGICSDLVTFTRRCLSGRTDRLASVILNVRGRS
jgi:nitroreductase